MHGLHLHIALRRITVSSQYTGFGPYQPGYPFGMNQKSSHLFFGIDNSPVIFRQSLRELQGFC